MQNLVNPIVLRKDNTILREQLPPLYEYKIECALSPLQYKAYNHFLQERSSAGNRYESFLASGHVLLLLCNHPHILWQVRVCCDL
jgi:SNF2 family DNA or RNA helicase